MNKKKGYKMECLVDGDECLSDLDKVDLRAFEHFREWFSRTEKEKELGRDIDNLVRMNGEDDFHNKTKEMGIGDTASKRVWKGMKRKIICDEGKLEGEGLMGYVPTFEEFNDVIGRMNPHSTGGISGLTYFMVQRWEERVKKKVFEELKVLKIRRS